MHLRLNYHVMQTKCKVGVGALIVYHWKKVLTFSNNYDITSSAKVKPKKKTNWQEYKLLLFQFKLSYINRKMLIKKISFLQINARLNMLPYSKDIGFQP